MQPETDKTLLIVELEPEPRRFMAALVVTFLALAAAWGMSARSLAVVHYAPTRLTSSDANLGSLVKYAAANDKNVAWVGSSLTAALSERYFTIPGSYNLGLSGGNPVTALEVLLRLPSLPKVLIIETNILDRPIDRTLVDRPWEFFSQPVVGLFANFCRPLHLIPAAVFYRPEKIRRAAESRRQSLLAESSSYRGLPETAQRELRGWGLDTRPVNQVLEESNATEINRIKTNLKSLGVRVYFIHLPYAPEFQRRPYSTRAQALISGSDHYNCDVCIDLSALLAMDDLGWSDGLHLDERSSVIVIDTMEKIVREQPGANF
jgi:hypothetical protein